MNRRKKIISLIINEKNHSRNHCKTFKENSPKNRTRKNNNLTALLERRHAHTHTNKWTGIILIYYDYCYFWLSLLSWNDFPNLIWQWIHHALRTLDINLAATFSWLLRHRLWFLSHLSHHMSRLLPARQLYKSMPVGFYHTIYNTKKNLTTCRCRLAK